MCAASANDARRRIASPNVAEPDDRINGNQTCSRIFKTPV
jgi:hypothetical protein